MSFVKLLTIFQFYIALIDGDCNKCKPYNQHNLRILYIIDDTFEEYVEGKSFTKVHQI